MARLLLDRALRRSCLVELVMLPLGSALVLLPYAGVALLQLRVELL